jgi:hypothetical protein
MKTKKDNIRAVIDSTVYGDESKKTNWSDMISDAMLAKAPLRLSEFLSSGKGFNDKTKEAFCILVGSEKTLTAKGINLLIAKHCDISIEEFDLITAIKRAKKQVQICKQKLEDAFSNGSEAVTDIDTKFNNGFNKIVKNNKKTFLINDNDQGFHMHRVPIKNYAIACSELLALNNKYDELKA